ncbi:protein psiN-like [Littorina saxatilis]|uniref:WAP domain-containing protein n=1 Tax=Littorina saxatilis TaxID=31220 RepID=A0AAN9GG92_9CAEN
MKLLIVTSALLSFVLCKLAEAVTAEPLCQNIVCQQWQICRVLETCDTLGSCHLQAVCLPQGDSSFLSGGCRTGEPLLVAKAGGGYDLGTCFTSNPCPSGFYCSTELQDVGARCCRAAAVATKQGSCPLPDNIDRFLCVEQCLSDADCGWDMKCCQESNSCAKRTCSMPEPCSVKNCSIGQSCVVDPDYRAQCVPGSPPAPPMPLDPLGGQPPPVPTGGSANTGSSGQLVSDEPLCQGATCDPSEECRVVETCNAVFGCSLRGSCLPREQVSRLGAGCNTGEPVLEATVGEGYKLRTCFTGRNCADGFYCSTVLQDVSSRCCRAAAVSTQPKAGTCPALDTTQYYFCVDQCLSDADCEWNNKCCQKSTNCISKTCQMPDPCSVKDCPAATECILDPGNNAACVAVAPPTMYSDPFPTQPPYTPGAGRFWSRVPSFRPRGRISCPNPSYPFTYEGCLHATRCGYRGARNCPRGTYCCATTYCGNICRTPVAY